MNRIYHICLILLFFLIISACEKLPADLKRSNPLDNNNPANAIQISKYTIVYDGNGDKAASKGETIYMEVFFHNYSKEIAHFVTAVFSSESPYIQNIVPQSIVNIWSGYQNNFIDPGGEGYGVYKNTPFNANYSFKFDINPNTPSGIEIPIKVDIKDLLGNSYSNIIKIKITEMQSKIQFHHYKIVYDSNNNGIVESGETIYVRSILNNVGKAKTKGILATVSSPSASVVALAPIVAVNYLNSVFSNISNPDSLLFGYYDNAPNDSIYSFRLNISSNTAHASRLPFNIQMLDIFNNLSTDTFSIYVP